VSTESTACSTGRETSSCVGVALWAAAPSIHSYIRVLPTKLQYKKTKRNLRTSFCLHANS